MSQATCVFHPGKPATSTCKQCGKTTCTHCTISGPTGSFCSTPCRTANEARVIQANGIEEKRRSTFFLNLRAILAKLIILIVLFGTAAWVSTFIYIPFLSEAVERVRTTIGI
mgnify:CR=1 FL=1